MKLRLLMALLAAGLLGRAAPATGAAHDMNEGMLMAEVTFGTAGLYLGATNWQEGYRGNCLLAPGLLGLAVGITSVAFAVGNDAEIPLFDLAAGVLAVTGSFARLPRASAQQPTHPEERVSTGRVRRALCIVAGSSRLQLRLSF
jgi:hypothetical protein